MTNRAGVGDSASAPIVWSRRTAGALARLLDRGPVIIVPWPGRTGATGGAGAPPHGVASREARRGADDGALGGANGTPELGAMKSSMPTVPVSTERPIDATAPR